MIDSLLKSIKQKWESDARLVSLITGGLHVSMVPDQFESGRIDLPYAYVTVNLSRPIYTMDVGYHEVHGVEFVMFYANSAESLETCVSALKKVFDWCELNFEDINYESVYFQPIDSDITCTNVLYRDGSMIYRAALRYESWISINYTPDYPPHPEIRPK